MAVVFKWEHLCVMWSQTSGNCSHSNCLHLVRLTKVELQNTPVLSDRRPHRVTKDRLWQMEFWSIWHIQNFVFPFVNIYLVKGPAWKERKNTVGHPIIKGCSTKHMQKAAGINFNRQPCCWY